MAPSIEHIRFAVERLEEGNNQACISTLQTLLLQPGLPLFWRIHALALLSHAVEDWLEAQRYQRQAEMFWRLSRRLLPEGLDDEFERTLRINRGFLDQIAVMMISEMPDELKDLQEEAKAESQQVLDGDNDTPDIDDGPDGEPGNISGEEPDGGSDDSCGGYDADDEADHDEDEQEVETPESSPDLPFDDMPPHTPEAAIGTTETLTRSRDADENGG